MMMRVGIVDLVPITLLVPLLWIITYCPYRVSLVPISCCDDCCDDKAAVVIENEGTVDDDSDWEDKDHTTNTKEPLHLSIRSKE